MATVFTHISLYIYTVYITACLFVISINTWCALWEIKFLLTVLFSAEFCLTWLTCWRKRGSQLQSNVTSAKFKWNESETAWAKTQPRSQSPSTISDVTSPVKLVGKIRARFQASSSNSDSANWLGYEAELSLFRHCKWDTDSHYVHTVTDSFCAGTKTIPDEAFVHIYKKRWFRHNFCNGA